MKERMVKKGKIASKSTGELTKKARQIRKKVLEIAVGAGAGHIAPSFSCIEILVAIYYGGFFRIDSSFSRRKDRDRFILSKGHAAPALYSILADKGFFPGVDLEQFAKNGSYLGCHPENSIPGVEAFTGSLGHGLSIGAGLAWATQQEKIKSLTTVLLGDGECHEGSVWEAAMFAAQHQLSNLVVIVDHNGLSATGVLKDYLEVEPLGKKWEAFGWNVVVIEGHSFKQLTSVLRSIPRVYVGKPLAVIALTTKGKGISFMENKPIWHYRVPRGKELEIARRQLDEKMG